MVSADGRRSVFDAMAGFLTAAPAARPRPELHVAEPAWRYLRETYATGTPPDAVTAMMGLPIIVNNNLTGGQWQIREDGRVTTSGDMAPAPPGATVMYSPATGWLAISPFPPAGGPLGNNERNR